MQCICAMIRKDLVKDNYKMKNLVLYENSMKNIIIILQVKSHINLDIDRYVKIFPVLHLHISLKMKQKKMLQSAWGS